jgi:hypothetical protein
MCTPVLFFGIVQTYQQKNSVCFWNVCHRTPFKDRVLFFLIVSNCTVGDWGGTHWNNQNIEFREKSVNLQVEKTGIHTYTQTTRWFHKLTFISLRKELG